MRSISDATRIPVIAAVELSGPATAKGTELPSAMAPAITADETKVEAKP